MDILQSVEFKKDIHFLRKHEFLESCDELIDFDKINNELQAFYDEGFKKRGIKPWFGERGKKRKNFQEVGCEVVKEEGVHAWKKWRGKVGEGVVLPEMTKPPVNKLWNI